MNFSSTAFRRHTLNAVAFTLIEMLVVLAVLALLIITAAPVTLGVLRSSRLSSAGETLMGSFVEAQQMAIAQDTDVEVRIYQGIEPAFPGAPQWRAVQLFALQVSENASDPTTSQGVFESSGAPLRLDPSVIISSDPLLSSFVSLPLVNDGAGGNSDPSLTGHVAFHFHSDGSTDLTPGRLWFLTLVGQDSAAQSSPPANYFAIQVDSSTGRVRSYRP